jgi:hypothetical protein
MAKAASLTQQSRGTRNSILVHVLNIDIFLHVVAIYTYLCLSTGPKTRFAVDYESELEFTSARSFVPKKMAGESALLGVARQDGP